MGSSTVNLLNALLLFVMEKSTVESSCGVSLLMNTLFVVVRRLFSAVDSSFFRSESLELVGYPRNGPTNEPRSGLLDSRIRRFAKFVCVDLSKVTYFFGSIGT